MKKRPIKYILSGDTAIWALKMELPWIADDFGHLSRRKPV